MLALEWGDHLVMVYTEADVFKEAAADRKRLVKWDARKYKEVRREVPAFSRAAETRFLTLTMRRCG